MRLSNMGILLVVTLLLVSGCKDDAAGVDTGIDLGPEPVPDVAAPQPDTAQPDTAQPDTAQPDTAQPDTAAPDTQEAVADVQVVEDSGPVEATHGLCALGEPAPLPVPTGSNPGLPSPWAGTDHGDTLLGPLTTPSALVPTTALFNPDYSVDLGSATFDVHVPPGYDGSKPWGLVVFINAGDGGGMPPGTLRPQLEEHQLLWVAPDKVGNSVYSVVRMGWAHMAVLRMKELFNVDPARMYAMGRSGGARHANLLAFMHPETYSGVMAFCGAHYFQQVEQAFETHQPDSHYEFWDPGFVPATAKPFAEHLAAFGQRFSLMTADGDFREGDLLNIYHFGYLADDLPVRLFDTSGGHCAEDAEQMRSGLAFAEHPLHPVIVDAFGDGDLTVNSDAGNGWVTLVGQPAEQDGAMVLSQFSEVMSANRFVWTDRFGVTLRTRLTLAEPDSRGVVAIEPAPSDGITVGAGPAMLLRVEREEDALRVVLEARNGGETMSLLSGLTAQPTSELGVVIHAWDHELHLVLDTPIKEGFVVPGGVKVLDDRRTIIVRWGPVGVTWDAWPGASVLTLAAPGGVVSVGTVRLVDGVGLTCP